MAIKNDGNSIIATLTVNDLDVNFQLDSTADVNTICQKHVRKQQVSPTNTRLNIWNKTDLQPLGETSLVFTNPCSNTQHEIEFVVIHCVDGILLKGEAVTIPPALRTSIKKSPHSSHLSSESMLCRARNSVFWPHMSSDIKQMADTCKICQQMKPKNMQEPLKQHVDGDEPWQKVGLDIFQIADKHYLVTVNYYFNFTEVDLLTTLTSANTIHLPKKHFSRYRIPRMIVSDGAPQFSSQ